MDMEQSPEAMPLKPDQLNGADRLILDVLEEGRATPTLVLRLLETRGNDYSRQYVSQRIKRLTEHGHLENVLDTGVYELVDDPRDDRQTDD